HTELLALRDPSRRTRLTSPACAGYRFFLLGYLKGQASVLASYELREKEAGQPDAIQVVGGKVVSRHCALVWTADDFTNLLVASPGTRLVDCRHRDMHGVPTNRFDVLRQPPILLAVKSDEITLIGQRIFADDELGKYD